MSTYGDKKIQDLVTKDSLDLDNLVVIEDDDGTKLIPVRLIKQTVSSTLFFNNVEEMKSGTFLENEVCETLGYHEPGDGGGALYRITYNPTAIGDNGLIHDGLICNNVYRAEMIIRDGEVAPEQFGAKGDGVTDDTAAINKCIASGYNIKFNKKKIYAVKGLTIPNNYILDLNGSTLRSLTTIFVRTDVNDYVENITIQNGIIKATNNTAILVTCKSYNLKLNNLSFVDYLESEEAANIPTKSVFICIGSARGCKIINCDFKVKSYKYNKKNGIEVDVVNNSYLYADITIDRCVFTHMNTAIYCHHSSSLCDCKLTVSNCNCYNDEFTSIKTTNELTTLGLTSNNYGSFIISDAEIVDISNIVTEGVQHVIDLTYNRTTSENECNRWDMRNIETTYADYIFDIVGDEYSDHVTTISGYVTSDRVSSIVSTISTIRATFKRAYGDIIINGRLPKGVSKITSESEIIGDVTTPVYIDMDMEVEY